MTEHEKARQWRESLNLSRPKLAALIGYSPESVMNFELGYNRTTKAPIQPRDFLAYKLCCAAIASKLEFDWQAVTITLD